MVLRTAASLMIVRGGADVSDAAVVAGCAEIGVAAEDDIDECRRAPVAGSSAARR